VGRSTHRDWDSAALIFVNAEAGEKYVGEYGVQTSVTAATKWTWCGILCNHLMLQAFMTTQL